MKRTAVALILLAVCQSQSAQADGIISLEHRDCARLIRHAAADDVAFKPGVDVHGRNVAPADIGSVGTIVAPERFDILISLDLGDRLGIPVRGDSDYIAWFPVGTVSVGPDGEIAFDGMPLSDADSAALAARCQRVKKAR